MNLDRVKIGSNISESMNVVVEISCDSEAVKYEINQTTGVLHVDRFLNTDLKYPCNYGYVPETLADDGDPIDVLIITPKPIVSSAVINCRIIGMLDMEDQDGHDPKLIAVPDYKLTKIYDDVADIEDIDSNIINNIIHFFEHYKDHDDDKWVKIIGIKDNSDGLIELNRAYEHWKQTVFRNNLNTVQIKVWRDAKDVVHSKLSRVICNGYRNKVDPWDMAFKVIQNACYNKVKVSVKDRMEDKLK